MRHATMATVVACLAFAAPASAEVRSGAVTDPRDTGKQADVEQVRVGLDTDTSTLELTVRFYEGWSGDEGPRGASTSASDERARIRSSASAPVSRLICPCEFLPTPSGPRAATESSPTDSATPPSSGPTTCTA